MDEHTWRTSERARLLWEHLRRPSPADGAESRLRRLRLVACAACRFAWPLLTDERSRFAVETAERYADGRADARELDAAKRAAWVVHCRGRADRAADAVRAGVAPAALALAEHMAAWVAHREAMKAARHATEDLCVLRPRLPGPVPTTCGLLREVFGDPLRPAAPARPWGAGYVLGPARSAYDGRTFERLPAMAASLEEAGCEDFGVLAHLRGPGPHVRGCWALDLILGNG